MGFFRPAETVGKLFRQTIFIHENPKPSPKNISNLHGNLLTDHLLYRRHRYERKINISTIPECYSPLTIPSATGPKPQIRKALTQNRVILGIRRIPVEKAYNDQNTWKLCK